MGLNFKKHKNNSSSNTQSKSGKDFELLPDDKYTLEAEDVEAYKARTGTPMLKVQFSIIEGKYKNRKVWHQFPLTEKAMFFIIQFLEKIGSSLADSEDVEVKDLISEINGSKVEADVTTEQLSKGPINVVDKFHQIKDNSPEPSMSVSTPVDDDDIFS